MIENYRYREFGEMKKAKSVLPWKLFFFSLVFALISFGIYFFLNYYYLPSLNRRLFTIRKETHDLISQINTKEKQEMIVFWSQIKNIESLLASHTYPSKILDVLEANILPGVSLRDFSLKRDKNLFTIIGEVKNQTTFAQQVYILENLKGFKNVFIKNMESSLSHESETNQTVQNNDSRKNFELEVIFDPQIIKNYE